MSQILVTGEAKIREIQGPVVANSGVITALNGSANQYVRGDGALASFPTVTGGGSSVSFYLNGSVNQGTFGGSNYRQLGENAITGVGTNFSTSTNGLLAQFITDANVPDQTEIPSGNWNIEFYMGVSASSGSLASFYVEIYKYDGTTFTLVGTNVTTPEFLTNTTTIDAYFTSVAMPLTTLNQTDRIAVRVFANVASKTVTLYTEDNRLCQVVTTFSRGVLSINNLTDQQQYFAVGTSGTNFNIASSVDTHTFNLPVASATNTGKLSSTDWSTFNNKQNAITLTTLGTSGVATLIGSTLNIPNYTTDLSGYVTLGTTQTITGTKTFDGAIRNESGLLLKNGVISGLSGYTSLGGNSSNGLVVQLSGSTNQQNLLFQTGGAYSYTFPASDGTIALTSNLSAYVPYIGATGSVDLGSNSFTTNGIITGNVLIAAPSSGTSSGVLYLKQGNTSVTSEGNVTLLSNVSYTLRINSMVSSIPKSIAFNFSGVTASTLRTFTLPDASGTLALTSDLGAYVTLATTQTISGAKTFSSSPIIDNGTSGIPLRFKQYTSTNFGLAGYTDIIPVGASLIAFSFGQTGANTKTAYFSAANLVNNTPREYIMPNADGTIALLSDLGAYLPLSGGTLTGPLSGTTATFSGIVNLASTGNQTKLSWLGYNSAYTRITSDVGFDATYNGTYITNNTNAAGNAQGNTAIPSWALELGGSDSFKIKRSAAGSFTFSTLFNVASTGAATFSSSVTATKAILGASTATSSVANLEVFGSTQVSTNYGQIRINDSVTTSKTMSLGVDGANNVGFIQSFQDGIAYRSLILNGLGGNVGIGTSSPATEFGYTILSINNATYGGLLDFSNNNTLQGRIGADTTGMYIQAKTSIPMIFYTANTERMRITSGGRVGIADSNPNMLLSLGTTTGRKVHLYNDGGGANDIGGGLGVDMAGFSAETSIFFGNYSGSGRLTIGAWTTSQTYSTKLTILANGSIGAPSGTNIYNPSDLRLKKNIETITNGLDKIISLNPVKFNWIDGFDLSEDGKDMLGFIAQEVKDIIPEAVEGFSNGSAIVAGEITVENPLRVNEKFIIPVLVKAIQEQTKIIKDLEARIKQLENK